MAGNQIEAALDEVLDGDVLTDYFNYSGSERAVLASELLEQVRKRVDPMDDLEARVDAAVEARGGEKRELIEVGERIKNLGRRLIGHSPDRADSVYLFP